MASRDQGMKKNSFVRKDGNRDRSKNQTKEVRTKRKWIQDHKQYEGSVKEGQGFAFQRKQRVKHEYNKLLRKERKRNPGSQSLYEEKYPENLKHLYMAEAQKLKSEAWTHRLNRSKVRMRGKEGGGKKDEEESAAPLCEATDTELGTGSEPTCSLTSEDPKVPGAPEEESLPISNRMRKKMQRKTSYQKTKEDFEAIKEKRRKKKEEYLKDKQQREEAIQRYKQKKIETYQMLSKKTKKGQPNLNLQMEYLLEKIQGRGK